MDSEYLKKNVLPALGEAIGAMAVQVPEDEVDFLGRYMLAYVSRKEAITNRTKEISFIEEKLSIQRKLDEENEKIKASNLAPEQNMLSQYKRLLEGTLLKSSKEEAVDSAISFVESSMNIPSVYYGVKIASGENELIKYTSAGSNSQLMIGKKLMKPANDDPTSEDFVERQGVSFDAFKVPEVPEDENPPEDAEGGEPVKKGPPPLNNLIIPNVMRDKRVKFFGIPKLGSYVACPFKYSSLDHDGSVRYNPGDGAEVLPSFELVQADYSFLIGFDSVGSYRLFKVYSFCGLFLSLIFLVFSLKKLSVSQPLEIL
jgi:hypothetical protein